MQQKQTYVRDTLVNVQRFLDANATALGPVNTSGARKALDDAIAGLTDHSVAQGEHIIGSTGETSKQRALRLRLRRRYLAPIAHVAAAKLGDVPEIATLRLPSKNLIGSALVDAANAMANAAAPYAATFTAAGLKPDFLDALRTTAQDMETSLGGRTDHVTKRRGSTIALGSAASAGRTALRLLDAVIQQQVPDDAQLLAEWSAIKRIPRKPGPSRAASVAVAPSAPAPSVPTLLVTAAAA
jgi:hypothetical protein